MTEIVGESDRGWSVGAFFSDAAARNGLFADGTQMSCAHEPLLPRAELVARVASMSAVATLDEVDRAEVFSRVRAHAEAAPEPIRLAYVTEAYAFRRRD